jgi:fatty acid amide hydrolase
MLHPSNQWRDVMTRNNALRVAMSNETDICRLSATELARRIASGEIFAIDAVEALIERIERVNPKLNAVVVKRYDAARAEARAVDARRARGDSLPPLAGVPVTIKECLDLKGTPSTFGLKARANTLATEDDPYVRRLREAGAIVLGKTNVAQILMYTESDNPVYGRSNNPWNVERTPGGSSGGQTAIIAAGGSALGLGTDIGGSLRIPAHYCGIATLRPTAGRIPDAGRYSVPTGQQAVASQTGPLARDVEDLALGLAVINGASPMPLGDFRTVDVSKLRVGVFTDDGFFTPSPAIKRAVREAAEMLAVAGATIVPWQPPAPAITMGIWLAAVTADRGKGMKRLLHGEKVDPRIGALLKLAALPRWARSLIGKIAEAFGQKTLAATVRNLGDGSAAHYWRTVEAQIDYQHAWRLALDEQALDVVLCPAYGVAAVRHGANNNLATTGSYALLVPVLGYPAGIVPVTRVRAGEESERPASKDMAERTARASEESSAGLPVGVQVIARPWREDVALAAMAAVEAAARKCPDYPAAPAI